MNSNSQLLQQIGAVILPHIGGIVGAKFFPAKTPWYENLRKPSVTPPNWVFPVAWTSLYTGMGYASYLVWRDGGGFEDKAQLPLMLYGSQLALNWAWTPLFFGAHNIAASLIDMGLLLGAATGTAVTFYKVNKTAGFLMVPYLLWLGLATYLNFSCYQLNKEDKPIESKK